MRFLRAYFAQLQALLAPAHSLDPADVASYWMRRRVAMLLLAVPVLPFAIAAPFAWDAFKDARRDAALRASPCMDIDTEVLGLGEFDTNGYVASENRCDVTWKLDGHDLARVTWRSGEGMTWDNFKVVERWDWDRDERVERVVDGAGDSRTVCGWTTATATSST